MRPRRARSRKALPADAAIQSSTKLQDLSQLRSDMMVLEARIRELTGAGGASSVTLKALGVRGTS